MRGLGSIGAHRAGRDGTRPPPLTAERPPRIRSALRCPGGEAALAALVGAFVVWRVLALGLASLDLYPDEAYYFAWSEAPALGYYSKPPLIAWVIGAARVACGDGELCIRLPSVLAWAGAGLLAGLCARRLAGARAGFLAAALLLTFPATVYLSGAITTDALLALCWTGALYALLRALESDRWRDWLACGLAGGLGLLAKPTMGFFAISVALVLACSPEQRHRLASPRLWGGGLLALLVLAPNLWWNWRQGFPTFEHLGELSHLGQGAGSGPAGAGSGPDLAGAARFLTGQLLLVGPLFGLLGAWVLARVGLWSRREELRLGALMALPLLAFVTGLALLGQAHLNWALPAWLGVTLLVAAGTRPLGGAGRVYPGAVPPWLVGTALAVNLGLSLVVAHFDAVTQAFSIELDEKSDLYDGMRGWSELGARVAPYLDEAPEAGLMSDDRKTLAALAYYVRPRRPVTAHLNTTAELQSQYDLDARARERAGRPWPSTFVLVARFFDERVLARYFREVTPLDEVRIPGGGGSLRTYRIYRVAGSRKAWHP